MSDDRRDYTVLVSLMMREEAEVAAAALRADGVDAFIGNSNHAYTNWGYTIALGGLQILVPYAKMAEARALLRERIRENASTGDEDRTIRRDRWKVWLVFAYPFALALFQYALDALASAVA